MRIWKKLIINNIVGAFAGPLALQICNAPSCGRPDLLECWAFVRIYRIWFI